MVAKMVTNLRHFRVAFSKQSFSKVIYRTISFESFCLDERLIKRLRNLGIVSTTDIQKKSIDAILKGKNAVVNAETGSGKTLCYLLPIVNQLLTNSKKTLKYPSALILLPNVELCYQVADVFKNLADPDMLPCVVHRDSKLCVSNIYPVVMATPNALLSYNLNILNSIKTVVTDEADLMITSGGRDVWTILNFFNEKANYPKKVKLSHWGKRRNPSCNHKRFTERQFIFAAATLPSRGRKAASNLLQDWLPDCEVITTDAVHNTISTAAMHYVKVEQHSKFSQLLRTMNKIAAFQENMDNLSCKFERIRNEEMKVLVFANTLNTVDKAFEFLTSTDIKLALVNHQCNVDAILCNNNTEQLSFNESHQISLSRKETSNKNFWYRICGRLHKNIPLQDRLNNLERFRAGEVKVLFCTDMASRGLDIRDVSHVIQLDFAPNSATFLHRAGRTARAGASGSVISFVTEEDEDLARVLRSSTTEQKGYQHTFSRNRMFRRRVKSNTLSMADPLLLSN